MAIRMSGLTSGMDTESIVKELMSAQRYKVTKIQNKQTKLEWKQDKWKDLNKKIYSFYTGSLSKAKLLGNYDVKSASSSNSDKVEVKANGTVPEGNQNIQVKALASAQIITGAKLDTSSEVTDNTTLASLGMNVADSSIDIEVGTNKTALSITASTTIGDFVSALKNAGLNASFDSAQKRFFISSKESGYENAFSMKSSSENVDLTKLGLGEITKSEADVNGVVEVTVSNPKVSLVKPSDAIIIYNGAELKSSTNNITANGLTITAKGVTKGFDTPGNDTDDEVISINVKKDTQATYDLVKNFIKSYNELLKEMNTAYNADLAKGYEPLTDEQKEAMSEEQEKKWEDKIKDSLLRRDNTLGSLISSMRTILSKGVTVEGKNYSLASFGITAADYTEKGQLHINGDTEDTLTSAKEKDLMKALSENPDAVKEVFTQLSGELYKTLSDNMKSTSLRSALTLYNDKEMKNTIKSYKADISDLEDKLADMENRYYRQFTAMEKAMASMNSKSSSLLSMLGQNSN